MPSLRFLTRWSSAGIGCALGLLGASTACGSGTPSQDQTPAAGGASPAGAPSVGGAAGSGGSGANGGNGAGGLVGTGGTPGASGGAGSAGLPSSGGTGGPAAGSAGAAPGGGGSTSMSGSTSAGSGGSGLAGGTAQGGGGGLSASAGAGGSTGGISGSGSGGDASDPCAKPGVLLCDDFEAASAGMAPGTPWTTAVNGLDGTVLVDGTTPAHSGTKSVHVASLGNYQTFLALRGAPVFPAPNPALYARVYLRLGAPMTGGHNTYFKAGAADVISSNNETRVGVMVSMLMINQPDADRGFLSNESYWTDMMPGVVFPEQTWVCVEGFFDPPNSTVDFWVNGTEVPDLHRTDWKQDALGSFHFGFEKYAGPDADIWYDDIVISTQPIGCN